MGEFNWKYAVHMPILEVDKLIEWIMSVPHNDFECRLWNVFGFRHCMYLLNMNDHAKGMKNMLPPSSPHLL